MKIWDMLKDFWVRTGEIDVDPEADRNIIETSSKLSAEDRAMLLNTLHNVDKKTEDFVRIHSASPFGEQIKTSVKSKETKQKTVDAKEYEDELEL